MWGIGQETPVRWVIIIETWYYMPLARPTARAVSMSAATARRRLCDLRQTSVSRLLALPGERLGQGLYIDPGVWHEAVVPLAGRAAFDDRQGRVHARVSCTFVEEFGAYLSVPLRKP